MLKMYHIQSESGSTPEFWEDSWANSQFEESVRFMPVDPLRPLFERYLRSDSLMLEGGCGPGNYVSYYTSRGYKVVGLDFAKRALKTLHKRQPQLLLCAADVAELPFADRTFDLYYSGGVVEHFEGGADRSLREARRVLKDDGILLISVPYYSPLRRMLAPFRSSEWRRLNAPHVDVSEAIAGKKFFQYAYRRDEFARMLSDAGLKTVRTQPYAVLWGLYELPFLTSKKEDLPAPSRGGPSNGISRVDITELVQDQQPSLPRRLIVSEDATVPVFGVGLKLLRWAVANMMMYVCKRD
jgi:SAM-dependent methyltransferase